MLATSSVGFRSTGGRDKAAVRAASYFCHCSTRSWRRAQVPQVSDRLWRHALPYQTANRLATANEALQAPLRKHAKAYAEAEAAVVAAETAVANTAATSDRLAKANEAKQKADQSVTDSAKELGCRAVCKDMLQTAVANATKEMD